MVSDPGKHRKKRIIFIAPLLVIGLLIFQILIPSCGGDQKANQAENTNITEGTDDSPVPQSPPDKNIGSDSACSNPYCVTERSDLGRLWYCGEPTDPAGCGCVEHYMQFPDKTASHAAPLPGGATELNRDIQRIRNGGVEPIGRSMTSDELAGIVSKQLNVDFIIDDINGRVMEVLLVADKKQSGIVQRKLVFSDPYVGSFEGLLMYPEGQSGLPAIIALHGHSDSPQTFYERTLRKKGPGEGFALLIPSCRALCSENAEHVVTEKLLVNGFTVQGLRLYETLLMLKYLQYLDHESGLVDSARVGLIGHSAGAVSVILAMRALPQGTFGAYAADYTSRFCWPDQEILTSDNIPGLWPYHQQINDFDGKLLPRRDDFLACGYEQLNHKHVWDFLKKRLR